MHITALTSASLSTFRRLPPRDCGSFVKIAYFSPDGSSYAAVLNTADIAIYPTSEAVEGRPSPGVCTRRTLSSPASTAVSPVCGIHCCDDVRDISFFPNFREGDPDSCCLLVASRGSPVHLYDVRGGQRHFSYKPIDLRDELAETYSVEFHPLGKYFVCGGKGTVYAFDIESPGTALEVRRLSSKRGGGQRGIVSTIAHCPQRPSVYACGDYNSSIGVYDHNESRQSSLFGAFGDEEQPMGPVTQLLWLSEDVVICGSRSDTYIRAFDLRGSCANPVRRFSRPCLTNQRLSFDVKDGILVSGTSSGEVVAYAADTGAPRLKMRIAATTVSSARFHPSRQLLLTASGSRSFPSYPNDSDNDCDTRPAASLRLWSISSSGVAQ